MASLSTTSTQPPITSVSPGNSQSSATQNLVSVIGLDQRYHAGHRVDDRFGHLYLFPAGEIVREVDSPTLADGRLGQSQDLRPTIVGALSYGELAAMMPPEAGVSNMSICGKRWGRFASFFTAGLSSW